MGSYNIEVECEIMVDDPAPSLLTPARFWRDAANLDGMQLQMDLTEAFAAAVMQTLKDHGMLTDHADFAPAVKDQIRDMAAGYAGEARYQFIG